MKKLMIALAVLALAFSAQAAVIANYTFDGSSNADSASYADMTASAITVSAGSLLYTTTSPTMWSGAGGAIPVGDSSGGWNAADQASAKYFFFTVTPDAGYFITLTGLDFIYNATGASAQNVGWSIGTTSQDGFARAGTQAYAYSDTITPLVITEATQIRIQGWGATSTGGNFRLDNVVLNGTVTAIPEPATMSLLGLGALAMVLRRKLSK
jgi:hypothetical protein